MSDRLREKLAERAEKRGWSTQEFDMKYTRKEARRSRAKKGIKAIGGLVTSGAETIIGSIPGGGILTGAISKVAPATEKIPVLGAVIREGADAMDVRDAIGKSKGRAAIEDLVPAFEAFEDGEYLKGAIQVAVFGLTVYIAFKKTGVLGALQALL